MIVVTTACAWCLSASVDLKRANTTHRVMLGCSRMSTAGGRLAHPHAPAACHHWSVYACTPSLSVMVLSVSCRCDISAHISGLPQRAGAGALMLMHCICLLFVCSAFCDWRLTTFAIVASSGPDAARQQGSKLPGTQMALALVLAVCTSGA